MTGKSILGAVVTGFVLFMFGFVYWAISPLPYTSWNEVDDVAAAQATAAQLFPLDGIYHLPGAGNDAESQKLLETGPSVFVTINHSPASGADPASLAIGFVHNVLSAGLIGLAIVGVAGLRPRINRALMIGVLAVFVINGSEVIWWEAPVGWLAHQIIYYLIYFALAAVVLNYFLPRADD